MIKFSCTFIFIIASLLMINAQQDCFDEVPIRMVVIGSSTAAGAGASIPDSAWVSRYRAFEQAATPSSEVINLAVGGYNSYLLMPSDNVPPSNRPLPDANRNITAALALSPDVVIMNLPSNDVASGYSLQEQLDNFKAIAQAAHDAGTAIYICTTQPRNFADPTRIQLQMDMRDSIFQIWGSSAIDFWSGLSDGMGWIDPAVDSGDGVHLNDAGHALLAQRVIEKMIKSELLDIGALPSWQMEGLLKVPGKQCAGRPYPVDIIIQNYSGAANYQATLHYGFFTFGWYTFYDSVMLDLNLEDCARDTFRLWLEDNLTTLSDSIHCIVRDDQGIDRGSLGSRLSADAAFNYWIPLDQWHCSGDDLLLEVAQNVDSVHWYADADTSQLLGTEHTFLIENLMTDTVIYGIAAQGLGRFEETQVLSRSHDRVWNGYMMDIIATSSLNLDSIQLFLVDSGYQEISIYTKRGSHIGFENESGAWDFALSTHTITVDSFQYSRFATSGISLAKGDTLGIYIHLEAGNSLGYLATSDLVFWENEAFSTSSGTGISHTFTDLYYPRSLDAIWYYSYDPYPLGNCVSDPIPVHITIDTIDVDLGPDTLLDGSDILTLSIDGDQFSSFLWSTGSSDESIQINGDTLYWGLHEISFQGTSIYGCPVMDTILINVYGTGLQNIDSDCVYPEIAAISQGTISQDWQIQYYDLLGRPIQIADLNVGTFLLQLIHRHEPCRKTYKLILHD